MLLYHFRNLERTSLKDNFTNKRIESDDLAVCIRVLDRIHNFDLSDAQPTEAFRANMSICGFWDGYFDYLYDFFNFFGWSNESQHHSFIRSSTVRFSEPSVRISTDHDWEEVSHVIDSIKTASDLLSNLDDHAKSADLDLSLSLEADAEELSSLTEQLESTFFDRNQMLTKKLLNLAHKQLFGATGSSQASLVKRYQKKLLFVSKAGESNGMLLNDPLKLLAQNWSDYLFNKRIRSWRGWREEIGGTAPVPKIAQAGDLSWQQSSHIYFDQHVSGAIYDTLLNVVHSPEPLSSPWDPLMSLQVDCWWRVVQMEDQTTIEFANAFDPKLVSKGWNKNKSSYIKLERCGGKVHEPQFNDNVCLTKISLPHRKN